MKSVIITLWDHEPYEYYDLDVVDFKDGRIILTKYKDGFIDWQAIHPLINVRRVMVVYSR